MARTIQLFISYKTGTDNNLTMAATAIHDYLTVKGYQVWMDKSGLIPGEDWNTQIYEAIAKSDVVLLMLTKAAAESEWVRREIDVARGAHVTVIPVIIRGDFAIDEALAQFDLDKRQCVFCKELSDHEKDDLVKAITANQHKTRTKQEEWLLALRDDENTALFKDAYTPTNKTYSVHTVRGAQCKIYLAAGDMTQMRDIDVLVNSENNYMQMARIFETFSLSSKLRLHGSRISRSGYIKQDTVQQALYQQIAGDYQLPIQMGWVVPTHAGHPESKLVKNGARYIFHAATVRVQHTRRENAIEPLDDEGIAQTVVNCLDMVREVDAAGGVISPKDSPERAEEEAAIKNYDPIESIIFPLFATGRGGREREVDAVARTMLMAFRDYLLDYSKEVSLNAIHLCAYSELDVNTVKAAMDDVLRS